ncbi:MAG: VWA domain-containing protein [Planctomycetaceae bacterium]
MLNRQRLSQSAQHSGVRDREGTMLVLVATSLPILIIMAAFAVDIAYIQLTRTELRVATDAAARAGGRTLSMQQDQAAARAEAQHAAQLNRVAGQPLLLAVSDIKFGRSERRDESGRWRFRTNKQPINALRIFGRRTSQSQSGPINLFFSSAFGSHTFEPVHSAVSTQVDRDIALVLDRSGSMAYSVNEPTGGYFSPPRPPYGWWWGDPAPPNSRWRELVDAVEQFLDALDDTPPDEAVSVATFSSTATLDVPLTLNYQDVRDGIDQRTQQFHYGATNIGQGIRDSIEVLRDQGRPFAARSIVVITDGRWNTGPNPIIAAQEAAAMGITIHAVTFSFEADQATMQAMAEAAHGKYWHAPDGETLMEIFRTIADNNPTLLTQ